MHASEANRDALVRMLDEMTENLPLTSEMLEEAVGSETAEAMRLLEVREEE